MTTCIRCNRALKAPASIKRGCGPICWAKMLAERNTEGRETQFTDRHIDAPIDEFVICERDEQGVRTNVPHIVTDHSPTGFEFGYGGSGPADMALNILEAVLHSIGYKGQRTKDTWRGDTCFKLAYTLHQSFKWDFIASMPREGGRIYTNDIISWIRQHESMVGESL